MAEFTRSSVSFPIAFVKRQLNSGEVRYFPVAIFGFQKGQNLFVSSDGRWTGNYIQAVYRSHPFHLGRTQDGKKLLCFDEDSGLLLESDSERTEKSEAFFDEAGQPADAVTKVLGFLSQVDDNKEATTTVCDLLELHKLIEPWPIIIKRPEGEKTLDGLFRVNEAAVRALKSKAVTALHQENALMAAYCQILSMQTFPLLGQLVEAHAKAKTAVQNLPPPAPSGEIDFSFLGD